MARWALISGRSGGENAAQALEVVERLAARGVRAEGFVQRKHVDEAGRKRYEAVRLHDGACVPLAEEGPAPGTTTEQTACSLAFHPLGFETVRHWLAARTTAELLLLDGIGGLEASGRGHCAALTAALGRDDTTVLFCARASQLFDIVERFALAEEQLIAALELPVEDEAVDTFVRQLEEACLARRAPR